MSYRQPKLTLIALSYQGRPHYTFAHVIPSEDGTIRLSQDEVNSLLLDRIPKGHTFTVGK